MASTVISPSTSALPLFLTSLGNSLISSSSKFSCKRNVRRFKIITFLSNLAEEPDLHDRINIYSLQVIFGRLWFYNHSFHGSKVNFQLYSFPFHPSFCFYFIFEPLHPLKSIPT